MAETSETSKQDLTREIASIDRDISQMLFYGGARKVLINGDETLRSRGIVRGLKLYEELERDCHVAAVLGKRKSGVCSREWEVQPVSEDATDVEVAEFVEQVLENLRFDQLTRDALDATLKGFSVLEIMWEVRNDRLVPRIYIARNQNRFVFTAERQLRLLTRENPTDGEGLPDRKFIVHTYNGRDGIPYGLGLGSKLFWPVFFKRQNITFWLIFNDKFGSPTALGKYPAGTPTADQEKLLQALRAISQDAAIAIPSGMEASLLEAARAGAADGYEKLCRYMDEQISEVVLGNTLTTTVSDAGGSRALGDVHQGAEDSLAKEDSDSLSYTLNETLIKWITELNFPGREPPSVWRKFDQPEDLDKMADRDSKLAQIGYVPDEQRVQEIYGKGYIKDQPRQPDPAFTLPQPGQMLFSESRRRTGKRSWLSRLLKFSESAAPDADVTSRQAERLDAETARLANAWIDQIRALLDQAKTLEEFRDGLLSLYPNLPPDEIAEVMRKGLTAAVLAGRYDIVEQAGARG